MGTFNAKSRVNEKEVIELIKENAIIIDDKTALDALFERIGDARIVMLGEASHGTHEYYTWRSYITKKLISEKNFNFIAVEGDWPDCYNINKFVKGQCEPGTQIQQVLKSFDRWPTWMWANWEIAALSDWLFKYNDNKVQKVGFYGLDVYSLWESLEAIRKYLEKNEPESLKKATETFRCFEPYKGDETSYAYASRIVPELCEDKVLELLQEIQARLPQYQLKDELIFSTEQNAVIAVNAEKYYRAMIRSNEDSWNIRDSHMQETLERLLDFHGKNSKAIVWAHNTHVGDASATDMADEGTYNIGELARKAFSGQTFLVGFGSYNGSVIAGNSWGAKMQPMLVPDGRQGSWEYLLHKAGGNNKLVLMDKLTNTVLSENRIDHRAIGVVYRPEHERYGNYVPSVLPARYDAFIYLDKTQALHPLHIHPNKLTVAETYPFGT
ncbi:erythromycin esterase family protein [Segetibacter sp.]|uniref:erythromycin esterase family protein n=1 Tax=Segetibacter sp. TaxID=2231182 RepID=UPI00261AD044|nr:erythromycin esterase family protein [Segetibacter sp.]MCW3080790.1 erythromycin esterase family protein [Segetibacter sp.]